MSNLLYLLSYFQTLLLVLALGLGLAHLRLGEALWHRWSRICHLAAFLMLSLSLMLLLKAFLDTDLQYRYVFDYSSTTTDTLYKVSGVWAGRRGTLLLWTWAALGAMGIEDLRYGLQTHKDPDHTGRKGTKNKSIGPLQRYLSHIHTAHQLNLIWFRIFGLAFILGLSLIQLSLNPFATFDGNVPDEGRGLNPLLETYWMAIHPPVIFLSYGLMVPVLASGLAYLMTHERSWINRAMRWARFSWVGMGLALLLGGYWAYVTLGWGGYWAWDPVETASLLPWVGLTAFLHLGLMHQRRGSYEILGPVVASLVVILVLFESFVTRGGLWFSVHAFLTPGAETTVQERFYEVLQNEPSVLGFFLILVLLILLTALLAGYALRYWPEPKPRSRHKLEDYLDDDSTMYATVFTMLLVLAVTLVLLLMGVNTRILPEIYNSRLAPLGLTLVLIFLIVNLQQLTDEQNTMKVVVAVGLLCLLGALVGTQFENDHATFAEDGHRTLWMLGLAVPAFIACTVIIIQQVWQILRPPAKKPHKRPFRWQVHVIHLGMVLLLTGYAFTTALATQEQAFLEEGGSTRLGGHDIHLVDVVQTQKDQNTRIEAQLEISGRGDSAPARIIHNDAGQAVTSEVKILHSLSSDLYLVLVAGEPAGGNATIEVRTVPGVNLVWVGALMVLIGELALMYKPMGRMERERRTFEAMLKIHCQDQHGTPKGLCDECEELLQYANHKLELCPFQEDKSTCAKCKIHCYQETERELVREVMRKNGFKMGLKHPFLSFRHILDGRRSAPDPKEFSKKKG